jgi:hypothetical protein
MKKRNAISELEIRLDEARLERDTATTRIDELTGERTAAIRRGATDEEIDGLEDQIKAAKRSIERASEKTEVIQADLNKERERVRDEEQHAFEKKADEAARKAAELMATTFEQISSQIRLMLRTQAEADLLIAKANKNRSGREPLLDVEARARTRDNVASETVSEVEVRLWCYRTTGHILSPESAARINSRDDITGVLPSEDIGVVLGGGGKAVEKRKFLKRAVKPAVQYPAPDALVESLSIPGLRSGDAPIWEPINFSTPDAVLAALNQLEAASEQDRITKFEFVPLNGAAANHAA